MNSLYLFLMYLAPIIIGLIITASSLYGIGKNEDDPKSTNYKVAIVFLCFGIMFSISGFSYLQANIVSSGSSKELLSKTADAYLQVNTKLLDTKNKLDLCSGQLDNLKLKDLLQL